MIDEPLSLSPEPVQPELLSIDLGQAYPYLDTKTAYQRASKANLGLSDVVPKTTDEVSQMLVNGQEGDYREEAAASVDNKNKKQFISQLPEVAATGLLTNTSPKTVIEEQYAKQFLQPLTDLQNKFIKETVMPDAMKDYAQGVEESAATGRDWVTKTEIAKTKLENIQNKYQGQSWTGWTVDQLKDVVSFGMYRQAKLRGNTDQTGFWNGLLGENIEGQVRDLYRLPTEQFEKKLSDILEKLDSDNPSLAVKFAHAVYGMSGTDKFLDDAFTILDLASIPGTGTLAKKALTYNATRRAVKDVVKARGNVSETISPKVAAVDGVGDLETAAVQKASENIAKKIEGKADPLSEGLDSLPSIFQFRIDAAKINPGRFGQEIVDRIERTNLELREDYLDKINNNIRVNRTPVVESVSDATEQEYKNIQNGYKGTLNNMIIDARPVETQGKPYYDTAKNVYEYPIMFGRPDGTLFPSEAAAQASASRYGFLDATTVEQKGIGWYFTVKKPNPETGDFLRDSLLETNVNTGQVGITFTKGVREGIRGIVNATLGAIGRYPAEVLSKQEVNQRNIATFTKSTLTETVQKNSKVINEIPRKYIKDFETAIDAGRHLIDPYTKKPGYFFESPGELEHFYQQRFGRLPEKEEIYGYEAFVNNYEMDLHFRRILTYIAKHRQGAEQHRIVGLNQAGELVRSDFFDGVLQKEWPGSKHGMMVYRGEAGNEWFGLRSGLSEKTEKELQDQFNKGEVKVIQLYDPDQRPLNGFGRMQNERVVYAVVPHVETKGLDLTAQLPRRGGGHFDYDYDFYIKYPKITSDVSGTRYEGDGTLMALANRKMGQDAVEKLHEIRDLIRKNDLPAAKNLINTTLPNLNADDYIAHYFPTVGPKGIQPPRLSWFEDFHVVPRGHSIIDQPGLNTAWGNKYRHFLDGTKEGSLAKQSIIEYTGERDVHDLYALEQNTGSRTNPIYPYEPAKFVDPFSTMNRAMNSVVNSMYMNDYKFYAMEHFLQEAGPYMKAKPEEIRHAPWHYFQNIDKEAFLKTTPFEVRQQLLNMHSAIKSFTGIPSDVESFLHSANQAVLDAEYSGSKLARLIPSWALARATDAPGFIRSMAYHPTLGLFNVPSFFTQASSFLNVSALSPTHAPRAISATLLHAFSSVNSSPAVLAALDAKAVLMGWKPGVWKEGRDLYLKTGFDNVGSEHAYIDNPLSTKFVAVGKGQQILDWGSAPFVAGSKVARRDAFYTAWSEYRAANPFGKPSRTDIENILSRSGVLDINMNRANNSMWNTGVFSLGNTFFTYAKNLAEVMTGTQISTAAKLRFIGISAAMYGIPMTIGVTGLPVVDYVRRQIHAQTGYVPGENAVSTILMEGLPSEMLKWATGNIYNINKYGSKGEEPIGDMLRTDKTMLEIMTGAGGTKIRNLFKASDPFLYWATSRLTGDHKYTPSLADYLAVMKEINSVNAGLRWWTAIQTGRWISKNEVNIDDVSALDASFMTVTGLSHQRWVDTRLMSDRKKEEESAFIASSQVFSKHFARATQAVKDGDKTLADKEYQNAFYSIEELAPTQKTKAFSMAMDSNKNLLEKLEMKYYMEDVPEKLMKTRSQAFIAIQQMKMKGQ